MSFSKDFPVLDNYTYLNTANSGILSRDLAAWRRDHDNGFLASGSIFRLKRDEFFDAGRNALSNFFRAEASRTFLVPNFSHGFNTFLNGLDNRRHFVLIREDYPSVNYAVECRGHRCTYIEANEFLEQNILFTVKQYNPNILAISLVQYTSGIMIDTGFLKQLKTDYPHLLIIADGTQFCGTCCFDFDNSGIDLLISSGYKWLLGGYGNGFVLMKEQAAAEIYKNEATANLPAEAFLKDRAALSLFFEPGHLDTLNFGTLFKSLDYLMDLGADHIEKKIARLAGAAKTAFSDRGLLSPAAGSRKIHSSIFNLNIPTNKITALQTNKIIVSSRGAGVRVSFHFYNTENDLENLLRVLD